jgi:hypothetical protein
MAAVEGTVEPPLLQSSLPHLLIADVTPLEIFGHISSVHNPTTIHFSTTFRLEVGDYIYQPH